MSTSCANKLFKATIAGEKSVKTERVVNAGPRLRRYQSVKEANLMVSRVVRPANVSVISAPDLDGFGYLGVLIEEVSRRA